MKNEGRKKERSIFHTGGTGVLSQLFRNKNDPLAKSRANISIGNLFATSWTVITANVFFVGFLRTVGATDTRIGTINMIMISCGLLQLVSPLILERFQTRKRYLLAMRGLHAVLNLGVMSVIPFLPLSADVRLLLVTATFVLSMIVTNGLIGSGLGVWHIQSVPNQLRASYFTFNNFINTSVNIISLISAGAFLDTLASSGNELYAFIVLRAVAALLTIMEIYFYSRAVEAPYAEQQQQPRLSIRSLLLPLKHKPFLLMMTIMMSWSFLANLSGTYYTTYLLNYVGISFRTISVANSLSMVIGLCTTPLWGYLIRKTSWLSALGLCLPFYAVFYASFGFVFRESVWIYFLAMIATVGIAPCINLVAMNLPYMHTPLENRTLFISLFTTGNAIAAFAGVTLGNILMILMHDMRYRFMSLWFGNEQSMIFLQAALMIALAWGIFKIKKAVASSKVEEEPV